MNLIELYEQLKDVGPEEFEQVRKQKIQEYIDSLPEERRERAAKKQWRIDTELNRCNSDHERYNKMVEMFWEGVNDFQKALKGEIKPPKGKVIGLNKEK